MGFLWVLLHNEIGEKRFYGGFWTSPLFLFFYIQKNFNHGFCQNAFVVVKTLFLNVIKGTCYL